jgi:LCP family protein required for cell wall assembly
MALAVLVAVVGVVAVTLLLNLWWIARPVGLGAWRGTVFTVIVAALATVMVASCYTGVRYLVAAQRSLGQILIGGGDTEVKDGRYNFLLLGADSGADREGLRPDSITVASVDAGTGRTVLFSLPRNLENAQFVSSSPLHDVYPTGFDDCGQSECMLNGVYLAGLEHADLYPDSVNDPGVQAMIDAVEGTLGLDINYYAMVNMAGFASLIDAVGGIDISLSQSLDIGIIDDWMQEHVVATLGPGTVHLDGELALLFARSRIQGNDFQRMSRQKCVMMAMLNQLNPTTVATSFLDLADAAGNVVVTDVPTDQIKTLTDLARQVRKLPVKSISFTPPLIAPGNPDFGLIRQTVREAIAESEAEDAAAAAAPATTSAVPPPVPAPVTSSDPANGSSGTTDMTGGGATPQTEVEDLAAICAAV